MGWGGGAIFLFAEFTQARIYVCQVELFCTSHKIPPPLEIN